MHHCILAIFKLLCIGKGKKVVEVLQRDITGAKSSGSCFGSTMGTEASNVVSESESLWPRFKRRIKWKGKNQASMLSPFSKYVIEISPNRGIDGNRRVQ